jgi:hypothetical protein
MIWTLKVVLVSVFGFCLSFLIITLVMAALMSYGYIV